MCSVSPQNPVSNPTAKQVFSWLNPTDRDVGLVVLSMDGLVFMLKELMNRQIESPSENAQNTKSNG